MSCRVGDDDLDLLRSGQLDSVQPSTGDGARRDTFLCERRADYLGESMRRTIVLGALVCGTVAGCSNSTASVNSAPSQDGAAHQTRVQACDAFDIGVSALNDEFPDLVAENFTVGWGHDLTVATRSWNQGIAQDPADSGVTNDMKAAVDGVKALEDKIPKVGSDGSPGASVDPEVARIQNAYSAVAADCAALGDPLTQHLKTR